MARGRVRPDLGTGPGKGEALWKSAFVTSGDVLVFIDADLTDWGCHFVTALIGPLVADDGVQLVKGFYDRVLYESDVPKPEDGRVTELVARPLIARRAFGRHAGHDRHLRVARRHGLPRA